MDPSCECDWSHGLLRVKLSLQGGNYWQWAKIVDAGCEKETQDKTCLAYYRDRIAVSFPKTGVKMWIWLKGDEIHCISRFALTSSRNRHMASSKINCSPKRHSNKIC